MKAPHDIEYNFFDTVYLTADEERKPYQVTGIVLMPFKVVMYQLSGGQDDEILTRYAEELTDTRVVI